MNKNEVKEVSPKVHEALTGEVKSEEVKPEELTSNVSFMYFAQPVQLSNGAVRELALKDVMKIRSANINMETGCLLIVDKNGQTQFVPSSNVVNVTLLGVKL